jgi:hypothetical protein
LPTMQQWHGEKGTTSKNWDPGNVWTAEETDRRRNKDDPPRKSRISQGKLRQKGLDQEPGRTRNPETTNRRRRTV